jgi:ABC-type transport system involved in cytochrome bd biosynthesis fused ATPase/permease subunit
MTDTNKSRFTEEQIIGFIKQAEAGVPIKELCRKGGSATPPSTSGGPSSAAWTYPMPKRLRELEGEKTSPRSCRPRRLDMHALKSVLGVNASPTSQALRHRQDDRAVLGSPVRISLTIEPGKTVALMGPSGSGKSTLAKLLQGFYWPSEGQIRIDGIDIRQLSANELRANFGVVPQETVLFSGSIYDNLMMANAHATFDQVVQACKMAEIHAVIEGLPQGYQTPIGERGSGLSGGQKQRLAIARALLKRPKVLIFDEATSALDAETAEHFAQTINALRGKVTMVFITHALPHNLRVDAVVQIGKHGVKEMQVVKAAPAQGEANA